MKFSVIVASHFRPLALKELLISLDQQQFSKNDFEVIVVPSPKDSALVVCNELQKNLSYKLVIAQPENDLWNGKSAAYKRNYGVSKSLNPWIAFTDDDCLADPGWLNNAAKYIKEDTVAIEGEVKIPELEEMTLTAKGMQSLTRPGGYQTCNMFYRKDLFLLLGGFDLNFPYYFEDSDLAWTVKNLGHQILYAQGAIITHPVFPNNPWKLVDVAKRVEKLVYLKYKHPAAFKKNGTQFFGKAWIIFLMIGYLFFATFLIIPPIFSLGILSLYISLIIFQVYRLYRGTVYSTKEFLLTVYLNSYLPYLALFYFMKGSLSLLLRPKPQKSF